MYQALTVLGTKHSPCLIGVHIPIGEHTIKEEINIDARR